MTIEERARQASYAELDRLSPAYEAGYIKGATEQEQITKQEMLDKACVWLYNNQPTIGDSMRQYIDNFRKAMEE